eukprot:278617_1
MYPKSPVSIYIRNNYQTTSSDPDNEGKSNREIMRVTANLSFNMLKRVCISSRILSPVALSTRYCQSSIAQSNSKQTKQKKRKYPKYVDPNYPKRPLNAYLRFWLQFQPEFMEKNKNINLANSAKIAGNEWYNLGDIQRTQYQGECKAEWSNFTDQIKQYRENNGFAKWKETKKSLPKKMYPKSPVSIYIRNNYQTTSSDPDNEGKSNREIMRELAEQWKVADEFVK